MELRLHPLYKKLLLLFIVLGPIIWLMLTEDGKRRTDVVMLHLLGKQELNLAIEQLQGSMTEAEFRAPFPGLELVCNDAANPFGDRLCSADVGTFNGIPARGFTLFLDGGRVRAAKLDYRRGYHELLRQQMTERLGVRAERGKAEGDVVSWRVSDGLLLMPAEVPESDGEAALIWLSTAALSSRAAVGG